MIIEYLSTNNIFCLVKANKAIRAKLINDYVFKKICTEGFSRFFSQQFAKREGVIE